MEPRFADYQNFNSYSDSCIDRRFYKNFHHVPHYHANPEIVYVSTGTLQLTIDGALNEVPAGHYCIVLPWQIHSYITPQSSECVILVFPARYISTFVSDMSTSHGNPQFFAVTPDIHQMFMQYLYGEGNVSEYMVSCILYGLCHCFVSACEIVRNEDRSRNQILMKMMDYVSSHFRENLSLKDVAKALGYNYYYVSHFFCEYSGLSFQQFRNLKRIDFARGQLTDTKKTITDIAFECGFASVRTFNRVFRDLVHMTPMEYRDFNAAVAQRVPLFVSENFIDPSKTHKSLERNQASSS